MFTFAAVLTASIGVSVAAVVARDAYMNAKENKVNQEVYQAA